MLQYSVVFEQGLLAGFPEFPVQGHTGIERHVHRGTLRTLEGGCVFWSHGRRTRDPNVRSAIQLTHIHVPTTSPRRMGSLFPLQCRFSSLRDWR